MLFSTEYNGTRYTAYFTGETDVEGSLVVEIYVNGSLTGHAYYADCMLDYLVGLDSVPNEVWYELGNQYDGRGLK